MWFSFVLVNERWPDLTGSPLKLLDCWLADEHLDRRWCHVGLDWARRASELLAVIHPVQEAVHDGRVFHLNRQSELADEEPLLAQHVALPVGTHPFEVPGVVLRVHLDFAGAAPRRISPLVKGIVHPVNRDSEVSRAVCLVRNPLVTDFGLDLHVPHDADESGPSRRIVLVERWEASASGTARCRIVPRGIGVVAQRVVVVGERVIPDCPRTTKAQIGHRLVEIDIRVPPALILLGLAEQFATDARVRNDDVHFQDASVTEIDAEGFVFVAEINQSVIQHIEGQQGNIAEFRRWQLDVDVSRIEAGLPLALMLRHEPHVVAGGFAVFVVLVNESQPLVAGRADVRIANQFLVDGASDDGILGLELHDFLHGKEAIHEVFDAEPVRHHLLLHQLPEVGLSVRPSNTLRLDVAGVGLTTLAVDKTPRLRRIVESPTEAEALL